MKPSAITTPGRLVLAAIMLLMLPATLLAVPDEWKPLFRPSLEIARSSGSINIDGKLDEAAWSTAARTSSFVERSPGDNTRPEVATDVFITYDDTRLYVAYTCHDNPSLLRATMSQRDQFSGDDMVGLLLDTYGDGAWAYQFFVNPYGVQKDMLWTPMSEGDYGFDVVWESAARRTDSGYVVEMAIPFASLRFPDKADQKWRVNFWRNRPREVLKQYSWAANDRNEACFPCQFGTVTGIRDVHPGKGLEVLPSMVAHQTGAMLDPNDGNSEFHNDDAKADISLGAKYSLSSDMTVEGTFNPDFSQIEADAAQIDVNSTVSLFYPERRPFFQEGSDIFQTPFNSFYSRTINNPQFASKFTERHGGTRLGAIAAYDENSPYMIPLDASNYSLDLGKSFSGVVRGSQQIGDNNQIGFFLADRRFDRGGSGTVLAADGRLRLSKSYSTGIQYIYTLTEEPNFPNPRVKGTFDAGKHTAALDGESYSGDVVVGRFDRNARHWNVYLGYNQIAPTYRTEIGFDPVANHRTFESYTGFAILPKSGPIVNITPQLNFTRRWDFLTGVCRFNNQRYGVNIQTRVAQTNIDLSYHNDYERWQDVPFGALTYFNFSLDSRYSRQLGGGGYCTIGRGVAHYWMARGRLFDYGLYLSLKPVDRLTIEPQLDYARMTSLENGEQYFSGYIMHTRLQFQGTKALSFRLVLQYDDFNRIWNVDPLITYRLSPFSLFYIGSAVDYSQYVYMSGGQAGSTMWRNSNRQVFMKIQYLFQT